MEMISSSRHRWLTAWTLVWLVSACAARPRFDVGRECELTNECAAPLVCRLGHCRTECRSDRDCDNGLTCFRANGYGVCEFEGERCVLSSECPMPLVCVMERCANRCETNDDCPPGLACLEGRDGVRGCRNTSTVECEYNSQCEAYEICAPDQRCREQCHANRDCRDGRVCISMGNTRVCTSPSDGGAPHDAAQLDDGGLIPSDSGTAALDASIPPSDASAITDSGMADSGMVMVNEAPPSRLVAGEEYACVVTGTEVRCWGDNSSQQLAPETSPLSGATLLAGSAVHGCAVTTRGVECWGNNESGQVGNGSRSITPVSLPVLVMGVSTPRSIAAAAAHTCAVENDGIVKCWGSNAFGQLGDGTTIDHYLPNATLPLASAAVEITTRSHHSCARLSDHRVQCWGQNGHGQLGLPPASAIVTPTLVPGIDNIIEVATGTTFSCVRRGDGKVLCWGNNAHGQLGDGTTTSRSTPAEVPDLPPIAELAAGANHVCARTIDQNVYCWGDNGNGQCGQDNTTFMGLAIERPSIVDGVIGATEIAAGGFHTCARVADSFRCWGANYRSQLGDGTTTESHVPVTVTVVL